MAAGSVDTGGLPGAPATCGTALATYMARRSRWRRRAERDSRQRRAGQPAGWRRRNQIEPGRGRTAAGFAAPCRLPEELLLDAQTSRWRLGRAARMPAEAFDTAMVLLALRGQESGGRSRA